jgi:toxin HigB-1
VIESFRHRGLRELFETGKTRRVAPDLQRRAKLRLDALEAAKTLDDLRKPGFDFHALQGAVPQRYTIHINGPWCITFEFENGSAKRVDLEQYH